MDQVRARNEIAARTVQGSHPKVTASKICTQKWILYDFISFGQMPFFRDFLKVMFKSFMLGKKMEIKESHPKFNRKFSEVALLKTQILLRRFYSQTSR